MVRTPDFAQGWTSDGTGVKGARGRGLRYEQKQQEWFYRQFGQQYLASPWFRYNGDKYCQPDGLLLQPLEGKITIVEFKLQYSDKAFRQVNELYLPVVRLVFRPPYFDCRQLLCCRNYNVEPDPRITVVWGVGNLGSGFNVWVKK